MVPPPAVTTLRCGTTSRPSPYGNTGSGVLMPVARCNPFILCGDNSWNEFCFPRILDTHQGYVRHAIKACGEGHSVVGGVCIARLGGGDALTNRSLHASPPGGVRAQLTTHPKQNRVLQALSCQL